MRAVTIAAAGAALLGSGVVAGHAEVHKHLHARSDWADWSSDPAYESTSSVPDATTKKTTTTPKAATTTTTTTTTESWADWSSTTTTTTTPVAATTTTTSFYDPGWEEWSSTTTTTTTPVAATTTTSYDPTETWGDWDEETSSSPAVVTSTSTDSGWGDWETSSTPAVVTSTDPATSWEEWVTSSIVKSGTTTTTIYLGSQTTDPVWEDWSSTSSAVAVSTSSTPAATSSAPVWSSDGWFGPGWGSNGSCATQVVTSYGSAIWAPTPDASSMPVLKVTVSPTASASASTTPAASSETWADWSSTSSDPAAVTSTSSCDEGSTWADWSTETSSSPAAVTSSSTTSYDPTTTWEDWTSATSSTSSTPTVASTTTWASSVASATPTGGSPGIGGSGNTWGMTYSPYTSGGQCKDAGTVESDLTVIASKGFTTVRVYSTDCSTLANVGTSARNHGLKLILGVFISATGINGAREQVWDIIGWAQWDLVELIVVGNEATFNGYCSAGDLAGFIGESKGFFQKAGYTGPVTTTEPLAEWTGAGSAFCSVIDVVAANLYAFFNAEVTADKAGDFIARQITELSSVCPGKDTYIMESGWPHAGNCNGLACPSPENQATALKSIEAVTGSKVIFFSYEDEAWKEPGEFGVEQYWGCAGVF